MPLRARALVLFALPLALATTASCSGDPDPAAPGAAADGGAAGGGAQGGSGASGGGQPGSDAAAGDGAVDEGTFPRAASEVGPKTPGALAPSKSVRITQSGTVLENVDVEGEITIAKGVRDVTIRNFRVRCGGAYWGVALDGDNANVVVEDGEIDGGGACHDGMRGAGYVARRLHVHDMGGDAFKADGDNVIERCFVTTLGQAKDAHGDGVQMMGGGNVRIVRNNFLLTTGSLTACIFPGGGGFVPAVHVEGNRLEGGGYVVYCNRDMTVVGNTFGRTFGYGIVTEKCKAWTGNVWADDGTPAE